MERRIIFLSNKMKKEKREKKRGRRKIRDNYINKRSFYKSFKITSKFENARKINKQDKCRFYVENF